MPAAGQRKNVVIAEMRDHFAKSRVWAKEVFANVVSILDDVSLEFSVNSRVHFVEQCARRVFGQQVVPLRTPHNLDHVPTCAAEHGFKFLDDFAVAAHWAVKTLQVAVDNKREVVQFFARCQRNRTKRFRFVAFAITEEGPHAAGRGVV